MNKNGMDGKEALELVELLGRLRDISLTDLAREHRDGMTPVDRMLADLRDGKSTQPRALRSKTGNGRTPKPKPHWRVLARKKKVHYRDVIKPRRDKKKALHLTTAEGWWKEQSLLWRKEARKKRLNSAMPTITEEEFVTIVYPAFVGRLPFFKRFDTAKPVSLDNLYIVDVDTEAVLFDGSEWALRAGGYII